MINIVYLMTFRVGTIKTFEEEEDSVTYLIATLFVEQPLALPWSG